MFLSYERTAKAEIAEGFVIKADQSTYSQDA